nr:hypothetical protein [uncultured Blautia sp.]
MGNLGKKFIGISALGAAAGAAVYYFKKKKDENPGLQEEFADFQDNLKETAASAVSVASKLKEVMGQSVEEAVNKVKEHTDDFVDDDIFEEEDLADEVADKVEEAAEEVKDAAEDIFEDTKDAASDVLEDAKDIADEVLEEAKEVKETLKETTEKED